MGITRRTIRPDATFGDITVGDDDKVSDAIVGDASVDEPSKMALCKGVTGFVHISTREELTVISQGESSNRLRGASRSKLSFEGKEDEACVSSD